MNRVGNDVVDLADPATTSAHLRERFVQRVLSPAEQARLASSPDPRGLLWTLFAAKEAAYKVLCKLGPRPLLAHRRFEVSEDLTSVRHGAWTLKLRVDVEGQQLHAVTWTGERIPEAEVGLLGVGGDASRAVRELAIQRLGGEGLSVVRLPVPGAWDGFGPPELLREGAPSGVDLSLSHDGRFVAFAAVREGLGP